VRVQEQQRQGLQLFGCEHSQVRGPAQQQQDDELIEQIDALRNGGMGGGGAPTQGGRVQSAGYLGQGMNTGAIGGALKSAMTPNLNPNGMTQPEMMNLMSDFGG